jgi:putative phosphoesterase
MKVGLLADIHANAHALRVVLDVAAALGVETFLVAGDLVGYYYEPAQVLDMLDARLWWGVRGNHEDMLLDWLAGDDRDAIRDRYGSGLSVAAETLTRRQLGRLASLPRTLSVALGGKRGFVCHGTPHCTDAYVYPDAADHVIADLAVAGHDLVVFGHSHYPVTWEIGETLIVNPGSVGQPRNRVPGAHWAFWDTEMHAVEHRVEPYDVSPVVEMCRRRDLRLSYLADVLTRV